jgi:hypothetical protein
MTAVYWPTVTVPAYEQNQIWKAMSHDGQHLIFYHDNMPQHEIARVLTLDTACARANDWLTQDQLFRPGPHANEVANLVRINLCYHSLTQLGNVKPMLLQYLGHRPLQAATGGTRMAALELIQHDIPIACFISTHRRWAHEWTHLEPVTDWTRFCDLAGAEVSSQITLRATDQHAHYGLDWYEVSIDRVQVPGDLQCLGALRSYLAQQPLDFRFCPKWFTSQIYWEL